GVRDVEFTAQRDDGVIAAGTNSQIHAEHQDRLPASAARRGPGPGGLIRYFSYTTLRLIRDRVIHKAGQVFEDRRFRAVSHIFSSRSGSYWPWATSDGSESPHGRSDCSAWNQM